VEGEVAKSSHIQSQNRKEAVMRLMSIKVENIKIDGFPKPDEKQVEVIAKSIKQRGLIHPIRVRRVGQYYFVIGGRTRLEAYKHLGLPEIMCTVVDSADVDDDAAELQRIAENLHRKHLSAAEKAEAVRRYDQLEKKQNQCEQNEHEAPNMQTDKRAQQEREATSGQQTNRPNRQAQRRRGMKTGPDEGSSADVARNTGLSPEEVRRARRREVALEAVGASAAELMGTPLDRADEMDALVKLPAELRRRVVESARNSEPMSAVAELGKQSAEKEETKTPVTRALGAIRDFRMKHAELLDKIMDEASVIADHVQKTLQEMKVEMQHEGDEKWRLAMVAVAVELIDAVLAEVLEDKEAA
jgi:ParB-like chromosome segregation protein Spo0J